jgi:hypothetical protein
MNQEQVEAWIEQNGGAQGVQHNTRTVEIDNPARDPSSDDYDPTAPKKISISEQSWVNKQTGATLTIRSKPGQEGTYEVVTQKGPEPSVTNQPPTERVNPEDPSRRQVWNSATRQWEDAGGIAKPQQPPKEKDENGRRWVWNEQTGQWEDVGPAAPPKQDPSKPPTERVNPADPKRRQVWNPQANGGQGAWEDGGSVAQDPSKPPTERVNPADPTKRQVWNPDTSQWEDAGPVSQKPPEERVNPADPKRRQRWDAATGQWVDAGEVYVKPDKQETKDIDGRPYRVVRDEQGNVQRYEPIEVQGTKPAILEDEPNPEFMVGQVTKHLWEYKRYLDGKLARGEITDAQAKDMLEQRKTLGQTWIQEQSASRTAAETLYSGELTQRGQDVSMANQRMSTGGSVFTSVLSDAADQNRYAKPGSDAVGRAALAKLWLFKQFSGQLGGTHTPPPVKPRAALEQFANATPATPAAPAAGVTIKMPDGTTITSGGPGAAAAPAGPPASTPSLPATDPQAPTAPAPVPGTEPVANRAAIKELEAQRHQLMQLGFPDPSSAPGSPFADMEDTMRAAGFDEDVIWEARNQFLQQGVAA